jgi:drug/metabolite transporter (DMT)-like permease
MTAPSARVLPLAWLLLLLLTLIWGSSFILIKRGLDVFSAGEVGALRMLAASLVMAPLAIKRLRSINRKQFIFLLSVGFAGSFFPAFLFAKAETRIDSSMAGVLNALTPMFVVLIGAFFYRQRISLRIAIGLLVGFTGTAMLMTTNADGLLSGINFYAFYIVLATVFYGMNVNIIKYNLHGIPAITLTSISMFLVLPVAAVYLFGSTEFMNKMQTHNLAWHSLGYIVVLGIFGTAVAMTLFNKLVQLTSPVFTSSVTYLIPIVAVMWGLFDGEILLWGHYLGMGAILFGVYITNRR